MGRQTLGNDELKARQRAIHATGIALRVTIGGLMRDMRLAAGRTQQKLAEHAGVSGHSTISQMELGLFKGKPAQLEKVMAKLTSFKANKRLASDHARCLIAAYCSAGSV